MHFVLPEAFHNHDDFHLAVNASSSLKKQIASTEKEWKILAELVEQIEQIQQSEKMLTDVRNRNFCLESVNAKILSMMRLTYKQRSSQVLLNRVTHDQASSTTSVVQVPAERMDEKSPEIWKGSVYTFNPTCTFEQKMGIACRENNFGPFYSSPVSVLPGESFDIDCFEDSIGVDYNSPAYRFKERTCSIESGEDMSMFGNVRGEDEYLRSDLLHAPVATPLAQEVHPPSKTAAMKCISSLLSERDECFVDAFTVEKSRMPSVIFSSSTDQRGWCPNVSSLPYLMPPRIYQRKRDLISGLQQLKVRNVHFPSHDCAAFPHPALYSTDLGLPADLKSGSSKILQEMSC